MPVLLPLQTELNQMFLGLKWCYNGMLLAMRNPIVLRTHRKRLVPVLVTYSIVLTVAVLVGLQLQMWLWIAGYLIDTSSVPPDLLATTSLMSNTFCLLSIITLFALRMCLNGEPCFFAVLRQMECPGVEAFEARPPSSIIQRIWFACSTTGRKLLILGLAQLSWYYPTFGLIGLPLMTLVVGRPVVKAVCGSTRLPMILVRLGCAVCAFCVAWGLPEVRQFGPQALWILQEGIAVSLRSKQVGVLVALATSVTCVCIPWIQEYVLLMLNMHAASSLLSIELLYSYSVRTHYKQVRKIFKQYRWHLVGFGLPLVLVVMVPGGGVIIWTYASGASAYLYFEISHLEQKRLAEDDGCNPFE